MTSAPDTNTNYLENETVVAVLPKGADEAALTRSVSTYRLEAESIVINNDDDYSMAAEFGRKLKKALTEVVDFFKPMKDAAHKAHREVCEREKTMLTPLTSAETALKKTMGEYALKKERERIAAEKEARRLAEEEANRKLAEAIKLEETGNMEAAESAMMDAQLADSSSRNITVSIVPPKTEGISQTKDWEIVEIDSKQVPISFNGMELRPVDEKAVIRLIKASKGKMTIPGITYRETIKTSIRRA
jgi:hypothetical protein